MEAYIRLRDADLALRAALHAVDAPLHLIDIATGALRHPQAFQCCTFVPPVDTETVGVHAAGALFSGDADAVVESHTVVDHTDDAQSPWASPLHFHIASEDEDQYLPLVFPSSPPFPVPRNEGCDTSVLADDAPLFVDAPRGTLDKDAPQPAASAETELVDAPAVVDAQ